MGAWVWVGVWVCGCLGVNGLGVRMCVYEYMDICVYGVVLGVWVSVRVYACTGVGGSMDVWVSWCMDVWGVPVHVGVS